MTLLVPANIQKIIAVIKISKSVKVEGSQQTHLSYNKYFNSDKKKTCKINTKKINSAEDTKSISLY